jgi:hypothetical protein
MSSKRKHSSVCIPLILLLLLAACNLQLSPAVTPTAVIVTPEQQVVPTDIPAGDTLQPTLAPPPLGATPTQFVPGGTQPTVIPLGGTPGLVGTGIPTLSAALADDRYEIQVRSNSTVGLNYTITLVTGTVTFTVQGVDGVLWQKTFTASETSRAEFTVQQGGMIELLVDIDRFDGNYSLNWD